jgi:hypothetical protein
MEAGACSCDYFDNHVDVYNIRFPVARKSHTCQECGKTIDPGSKYAYITACWEGSWWTGKRCCQCNQIADDYCCSVVGTGAVREWVWELLGVDLKTGDIKEDEDYLWMEKIGERLNDNKENNKAAQD